MLTVYTYKTQKPSEYIDLSTTSLFSLCETALAIVQHQRNAKIWLGYLDGWMLTPAEEVQMRDVIRKFACIVISKHPMSFSHAWKNEIDVIYTSEGNGEPPVNNNGRTVSNGSPVGHGQPGEQPSA